MAEKIQYDVYTIEGGEDTAINTLNEIAKEKNLNANAIKKLNPWITDYDKSYKAGTGVLTSVGSITEDHTDFAVSTLQIVKQTNPIKYEAYVTDGRTGKKSDPFPIDVDYGTPMLTLNDIVKNNDKYYPNQKLEIETLLKLNPNLGQFTWIGKHEYVDVVLLEVFVPGSKNMTEIKEFGILTDTTRTCYVRWSWDHKVNDTSGMEVKWEWLSADGKGDQGQWHEDKTDVTDIEVFDHQYNPDEKAVKVRVTLRPIEKSATSTSSLISNTETSNKFKWCGYQYIFFDRDLAVIAPSSPPSVEIDEYKLIASYDNLPINKSEYTDINGNIVTNISITHVEFQIVRATEDDSYSVYEDDITGETSGLLPVSELDGHVRYVKDQIAIGYNYKVRARCCKKFSDELIYYSSWTIFTSPIESKPVAPELEESKVLGNRMVRFKWNKIDSARRYTLEYLLKIDDVYKKCTSEEEYFITMASSIVSQTIDKETAIEVKSDDKTYITLTLNNVGDGTGGEYLVRVNALNSSETSKWSTIQHFTTGKKPDAPTTWSSTTTVVIGEILRLYWIHNSKDGSEETRARITYWVDGSSSRSYVTVYRTTDNTLTDIAAANKAYGVTLSDLLSRNPYGANDILEPGTLIRMPSNSSIYGSWYMFVVDPDEAITSYFEINTGAGGMISEGNKINWYVQTAGAYTVNKQPEYGPTSIERTVDVYAPPSLSVSLLDYNKTEMAGHATDGKIRLRSLPFYVKLTTGNTSKNHTPTGYSISVIAKTSYDTVDEVGNNKSVIEGNKIFSRYYDVTDTTIIEPISAQDLTLEVNQEYEVVCTVSMNSGLRAETKSNSFVVSWMIQGYEPNADVYVFKDKLMALIRPYSYAPENSVLLSVYRREYDGTFTEIATDIDSNDATWITDPHPALDAARYRIISRDKSTSAVIYYDVPAVPIKEHAVIIQWNEKWQSVESYNSDMVIDSIDQSYTGSMLRLPYNIDVANTHSPDVSLVRYIGRKRPVSYYGTQLGEAATWNVEIPKNDTETLYALRRLAIYMGDVYVREPSGSGYWASINVSFSQKHLGLTIPVTINITPVEGGM